ncbi:MAG: tannase/feruloyl esterase family alpha/beta hydrolase [Bryobacterales bacterium]|nr:tannase/feruloyl esterase family alpha/beta hydrolase [Bryobacterales bacterium]
MLRSIPYFLLLAGLGLAEQPCESLAQLRLNRAEVTSAAVSGNLCVVKAVARPTKDSEILLEVHLPVSNWNGRYRQVGNGGWAGAVPVGAIKAAAEQGYAAAGTDDGHARGAGDAAWAIGHPEKLIDFGHRAVHVTSVHAKAILTAFYGKPANKSYFVGCSDGGREALQEAQRYPEDFDGIVAGAPAYDWSHHFAGFVWNAQALRKDAASFIPHEKLPVIQKAALAACDKIDGVADGLVEDPRACKFNPDVLLCRGADGPGCLTRAQLTALKKIYSGPRNPRTGKQIYPGYPPSTEAIGNEWANWILGKPPARSIQMNFGLSFFGQAVYEDPNWNYLSMEFDSDVAYGDQKAGAHINSNNPDLRSFRANGGRLLMYHGWADGAISAYSSIDYYENVARFLGRFPDGRTEAKAPVQDFFRLFMVPGMGHCGGGAGPNRFGNGNNAPHEASRNIVAALEQWVEEGKAPEKIVGHGAQADFSRPLCPYPQKAVYDGKGNPNEEGSFSCQ